jgi:hypothetical protein
VTVELATGRYSTFKPSMGVPVRATVGRPKRPLGYELEHEVLRLAPWGLLDVEDRAEFTRRYRERLDGLDLDALVQKFEAISAEHGGRRLILLCFEDVWAGEFATAESLQIGLRSRAARSFPRSENLAYEAELASFRY